MYKSRKGNQTTDCSKKKNPFLAAQLNDQYAREITNERKKLNRRLKPQVPENKLQKKLLNVSCMSETAVFNKTRNKIAS